MENFEVSAGEFKKNMKIDPGRDFKLNCLSVLASGSGIICLNTSSIIGLGNQKIPMVFLNTKSGHYKCSQLEINKALNTPRVEYKKEGSMIKIKPEKDTIEETLREYLETLISYVYEKGEGDLRQVGTAIKLKQLDTVKYFGLRFADIKDFSNHDELEDIYLKIEDVPKEHREASKKRVKTFVGATTCSGIRKPDDYLYNIRDFDSLGNNTDIPEYGPLGLEERTLYNCCSLEKRGRKVNLPKVSYNKIVSKSKTLKHFENSKSKKGGYKKKYNRKSAKINKNRS